MDNVNIYFGAKMWLISNGFALQKMICTCLSLSLTSLTRTTQILFYYVNSTWYDVKFSRGCILYSVQSELAIRHQMETFSALLAICAGNSPVTGEFPAQGPLMRSFDALSDLRLINGWVNTGEVGYLRRHRANYDVSVMNWSLYVFRCDAAIKHKKV